MANNHHTGKDAYLEFAGVDISADYLTFKAAGKLSTADTTAGADDDETHLPLTYSWNFDMTALWLNTAAGGTVLEALALGAYGTIVYGPSGTASGERKYECPARIIAADMTLDTKKATELSRQFLRDGAWITDGDAGGTF